MTTEPIDIPVLLQRLHQSLQTLIAQRQLHNPIMIGIHTGGVWIAEHLHQSLQIQEPLSVLDISFYRDDFNHIGVHPDIKQSKLPLTVEGRDLILIDDIFNSGRTIRAALNEIFDYGRPNQVVLGTLIERDGRQMPIRPDCIGARIALSAEQRIKLTGPEPLGLLIQPISKEAD